MDKITQANAASAEESAAAAEELDSQAELMKQSVSDLLQLVGGNQKTTGSSPEMVHEVEGPDSRRTQVLAGHLI
jgi:methyl-accepting chemotaxis protein